MDVAIQINQQELAQLKEQFQTIVKEVLRISAHVKTIERTTKIPPQEPVSKEVDGALSEAKMARVLALEDTVNQLSAYHEELRSQLQEHRHDILQMAKQAHSRTQETEGEIQTMKDELAGVDQKMLRLERSTVQISSRVLGLLQSHTNVSAATLQERVTAVKVSSSRSEKASIDIQDAAQQTKQVGSSSSSANQGVVPKLALASVRSTTPNAESRRKNPIFRV
eukprot:GILJ01022669.1.p1 GENE.GILJ01022669.1~~GILJ01022669.1.p1  ORF type:complete len:223 (+),score=29.33 GILJ01022669.1:128-796(+)